jgi:small subunit ribosomal protein S17e
MKKKEWNPVGRIKTLLVKRVTKELVAKHSQEFGEDFTKNKEVLKKYANVKSAKLRNVIAGYISRLVKQSKDGKERRRVVTEDISKFY